MDTQVLEVAPDAYEALIDTARSEEPSPATLNGAAPLPPAMPTIPDEGPREERIFQWIDVPMQEGFQARLWWNFPQRLLVDVESGDAERSEAALQRIIIEHNGWRDAEGESYPPADAPEFWGELSNVLAARLVVMVQAVAETHPNLGRPKRPR